MGGVRFHRDEVHKGPIPGDLEGAADKVRQFHEVGEATGFIAPKLLGIDTGTRVIRLERLQLGCSLADMVRSDATQDQLLKLMGRAGRVLGELHARVQNRYDLVPAPDDVLQRLRPDDRRQLFEDGSDDPVVSHGDFGTGNIFLSRCDGDARVIIIDSFPNGYSSFHPAVAESRYIDLGLMDSCLMGRGSIRYFVSVRPADLVHMRAAFIDGYQRAAGVIVSSRLMRATASAILASYFHHRRGLGARSSLVLSRAVSARQGNLTS